MSDELRDRIAHWLCGESGFVWDSAPEYLREQYQRAASALLHQVIRPALDDERRRDRMAEGDR
ncbi:MAG: hypothetical protein ACXVXW_07565 [Mycobacteriaceae bacterium]